MNDTNTNRNLAFPSRAHKKTYLVPLTNQSAQQKAGVKRCLHGARFYGWRATVRAGPEKRTGGRVYTAPVFFESRL